MARSSTVAGRSVMETASTICPRVCPALLARLRRRIGRRVRGWAVSPRSGPATAWRGVPPRPPCAGDGVTPSVSPSGAWRRATRARPPQRRAHARSSRGPLGSTRRTPNGRERLPASNRAHSSALSTGDNPRCSVCTIDIFPVSENDQHRCAHRLNPPRCTSRKSRVEVRRDRSSRGRVPWATHVPRVGGVRVRVRRVSSATGELAGGDRRRVAGACADPIAPDRGRPYASAAHRAALAAHSMLARMSGKGDFHDNAG